MSLTNYIVRTMSDTTSGSSSGSSNYYNTHNNHANDFSSPHRSSSHLSASTANNNMVSGFSLTLSSKQNINHANTNTHAHGINSNSSSNNKPHYATAACFFAREAVTFLDNATADKIITVPHHDLLSVRVVMDVVTLEYSGGVAVMFTAGRTDRAHSLAATFQERLDCGSNGGIIDGGVSGGSGSGLFSGGSGASANASLFRSVSPQAAVSRTEEMQQQMQSAQQQHQHRGGCGGGNNKVDAMAALSALDSYLDVHGDQTHHSHSASVASHSRFNSHSVGGNTSYSYSDPSSPRNSGFNATAATTAASRTSTANSSLGAANDQQFSRPWQIQNFHNNSSSNNNNSSGARPQTTPKSRGLLTHTRYSQNQQQQQQNHKDGPSFVPSQGSALIDATRAMPFDSVPSINRPVDCQRRHPGTTYEGELPQHNSASYYHHHHQQQQQQMKQQQQQQQQQSSAMQENGGGGGEKGHVYLNNPFPFTASTSYNNNKIKK